MQVAYMQKSLICKDFRNPKPIRIKLDLFALLICKMFICEMFICKNWLYAKENLVILHRKSVIGKKNLT